MITTKSWRRSVLATLLAACLPVTLAVAAATSASSRTAELTLGFKAGQNALLGTSAALSANGQVAVLGAPLRMYNHQFYGSAEVYAVKNGKWTSPVDLTLAGTRHRDSMGASVAINAAGTEVLVGAPGLTVNGNPGEGGAFVFRFSNGKWGPAVSLNPGKDPAAYDNFGHAVALSADGNTALVGAPYRTLDSISQAGVGGVYTYASGSWHGPVELSLGSKATGDDQLGFSAALNSNGDEALLGAPNRVGGVGAAELFTLSGAKWNSAKELGVKPGLWGSSFGLGYSVALNGTGGEALVAPAQQAGQAIVYTPSGGKWTGNWLTLPGGARDLGCSCSSVALNSAGSVALVGAPGAKVNQHLEAGGAELFTKSKGTWNHVAQLNLGTKAASYDALGSAAAMSSNGSRALLGVPDRTVATSSDAGAGEVYSLAGAIPQSIHRTVLSREP